jgi:hypothetical protein
VKHPRRRLFAHHHTDDVYVDWKGQAPTEGIEHIEATKAYVDSAGATPPQILSHPIRFGSGEWTCVAGELRNLDVGYASIRGRGSVDSRTSPAVPPNGRMQLRAWPFGSER